MFIEKLDIDKLEKPTLISLGLIQDDSYNNAAFLLSDEPNINHSYVDIENLNLIQIHLKTEKKYQTFLF